MNPEDAALLWMIFNFTLFCAASAWSHRGERES